MFLSPAVLLWIVGKVDNPESTLYPETVTEIGDEDLVELYSLPQENLPTEDPVVETPTTEDVLKISQVTIPTPELNALT